ncbi:inverse autotransporter beta domain-containing protein [Serratia nevei]|uniref:inverse autotransporter beta domain-containing protein n=1 Tax=Serratia nevei TaxID=2703794 RepID=UPI003FA6E09F
MKTIITIMTYWLLVIQTTLLSSLALANESPPKIDNDTPLVSMEMAHSASTWGATTQQGALPAFAMNRASGIAGNNIEDWLQQFGTARIQLSVDNRGSWANSSADWLLPLYDSPQSMLFTQLGFRSPHGRKTTNIGLGVRTFHSDWMYGANVFFDHDHTGKNRRVGIGAEAWRDHLKLSGNTYLRTTDWHSSRDVDTYDERPADGWDIRTEAYLPAYPQLGGKLVYEKYRGNEVALTNKNKRQRNPSSVITGLSYTPIPLITASVDHRAGSGGLDDTLFSLQYRYQFARPWRDQISPQALQTARTLMGSRSDLVERNNAIVLDYRKQAWITLTLPATAQGIAENNLTLHADISSAYAVDRTEWETSSLLADGGKILQHSAHDLQIVLPPWQPEGRNQFSIRAVAYDTQGSTSNTATTVISVLKPAETPTVSGNITVVNDNAPADGHSTNEVLARMRDEHGNPLSGQKVIFTATNGATINIINDITDAQGQARATLTNTLAGDSTVTATFAHEVHQSVRTTFIPDLHQAKISLTTTKDNAIKDGVDENEVEATVLDANGLPISNVTVAFETQTPYSQIILPKVTTDHNGRAKSTIVSQTARENVVMAYLDNSSRDTTPVNFILLNKTYSLLSNSAKPNGIDKNKFAITLTRPDTGTPVAGQAVTFSTTDPMTLSSTEVVTDSSGTASVSMTSTTPSDTGGFTLIVDAMACCTLTHGGIYFRD